MNGFDLGDVVQIDPAVSPYGQFAIIVGFKDDLLHLKGADSRHRHWMHHRWCRRIGRAVWNPEDELARLGIVPRG